MIGLKRLRQSLYHAQRLEPSVGCGQGLKSSLDCGQGLEPSLDCGLEQTFGLGGNLIGLKDWD